MGLRHETYLGDAGLHESCAYTTWLHPLCPPLSLLVVARRSWPRLACLSACGDRRLSNCGTGHYTRFWDDLLVPWRSPIRRGVSGWPRLPWGSRARDTPTLPDLRTMLSLYVPITHGLMAFGYSGRIGISAHAILVFCDHSAVMVRIGTWLSSAEFALFPSFGSASRTRDGEYLFWA